MFDSMKFTRSVETAEAILSYLSCGLEVPATLLADAEEYGVNVDAIREKIEELYGDDEEEAYHQY